ncbi:MAG: methyltransferase domain-containing protein [Candidatus Bathyarchaeota archaeon]|nr:methyltransferase domain-containing protein [Candidatus Bathyarchaeota archaeon]
MNKWSQKRRTMRRYDLTAQLYDARYAEEQTLKYRAALEQLRITGDSRVLDVGCGTGLLFSYVTEAAMVVGVDLSGKLLIQAKERARSLRNVHLVQADADYLPFRDDSFSAVFAFTVLQNMPAPLETLREIKRVAEFTASIVVSGLKKAFALHAFRELLENAGLTAISLKDDDMLKCYVVLVFKRSCHYHKNFAINQA